jgi:hypothetical protein
MKKFNFLEITYLKRLKFLLIPLICFSVSAASFSVSTQADWNNGSFNGTSADRDDNSGALGLGYLNGSASAQPNQDALNNGSLVGYWRMDASSDPLTGSFDVKDYSGYDINGSLKNPDEDERGKQGVFSTNSFDFDGGDESIMIEEKLFEGQNSAAICGWAKTSNTGSWGGLFGNRPYLNSEIGGLTLQKTDNDKLRFLINGWDGSPEVVYNDYSSYIDGKWHHYCGNYNGSYASIYIDGEQVSSNSYSQPIDASHYFDIGRYKWEDQGDSYYFNGKIDEVRAYNQSLSTEDIEQLYLKGIEGSFEGNYTSEEIAGNGRRSWDKLEVNLSSMPADSDVDANIKAYDSDDNFLGSQLVNLSSDTNNYSLSIPDSDHIKIVFNGTSKYPTKSWKIESYTVYHRPSRLSNYVHTFKEGSETPRSFFGNNTELSIRTEGKFSSDPKISIEDSDGDIRIEDKSMANVSGVFEYNFTINQTRGWYDVKINDNRWENVFYQGEKWQGNYTDGNGNKYTFRRKVNVSEPNVGDRWFEPIDVNVDFGFSPDNDSIRVVAWNGSRMLEIPSQIYNVTKSGDKVSNANVVFLSTMNQSENRTYYILSAKSEYSKNYTGLNNTNNALDEKVENSRFEAFFNQSLGYLMRDVKDKLGSSSSLSGKEPMDQYPQVSEKDGFTSEDLEARSDITAEINVTEGPLRTELYVEGDLDPDNDYPYSVDCEIYAANPYMICEKNLTVTKSAEWKNLFFNGLAVGDGKMGWSSYRNSNGQITTQKLSEGDNTDYSDLDNEMNWISFYDNSTGDGLAEIFLQRNYSVENNPEIKLKDTSTGEIYQEKLIDGAYQDVSEEDYWYSETARMIYNGLREYEYVNKTYSQLRNPVVVSRGQEVTDDHEVVNYSETGNISTNDSSSVKVQSYWKDDTFLDYARINITGNGVNGSNTELYSNKSYDIRDSGGFTNESWVNVTLSNSTVKAGEISANITVFDVAGKSNSTLIEFNVSDSTPPEYNEVINLPDKKAELDPDQQINITANITEYSNVSTAFLNYKNDSVSDYRKKKMNRNSETDFVHTYEANFTPRFEDNYTYYVSTNDTLDQTRNSSKTDITVAWDYTWNFEPDLSGETATFNTNVSIGNFTINNTGDFNQTFKMSSSRFNSRTWVNGITLPAEFEIGNGTTELFAVNATTRESTPTNTEGLDPFNLTVENSSASPELDFSTFDVTTSTGGPFLFTEITDYNSTVTQGDKGVKLTAETTNKGNESANTVNITFELPNSWTVSSGESLKSPNTLALALDTSKSFTTKVDIPEDASTGTKTVKAVARSQETNRSTTEEVTVEKKQSSNNQQQSSSGGGGGGGSGGAGGNDLTSEQKQKLFQTEQTYEIVRGKDSNFTLEAENPFEKGTLENVELEITGFLDQYLSVEPEEIDEIPVNGSKNFTINIKAPDYFSRGEYRLNLTITGINNQSRVEQSGNESIIIRDTTEMTENRIVNLIVHEVSQETAEESLNQSQRLVDELKDRRMTSRNLNDSLDQIQEAIESGNYQQAYQLSQQVEESYTTATNANSTMSNVTGLIDRAEYRGLDTPRTSRTLELAEAALERGDYSLALERAEEARSLYTIETQGKTNYVNLVQRKWEQISLGLLVLLVSASGVFYKLKLFLIGRKISRLENEREEIKDLIEEVQMRAFEKEDLPIENYKESMEQYQEQLSENVQRVVELESQRKYWKNWSGKEEMLENEKQRIKELREENQKTYFEDQEISKKMYEIKEEKFKERLAEIEEDLAEVKAEKEIGGQGIISRAAAVIP